MCPVFLLHKPQHVREKKSDGTNKRRGDTQQRPSGLAAAAASIHPTFKAPKLAEGSLPHFQISISLLILNCKPIRYFVH